MATDNQETSQQIQGAVAAVAAPLALPDQVVEASTAATLSRIDAFLAEPAPKRALAIWIENRLPAAALRAESADQPRRAISQLLSRDIAGLDAAINKQLNAIIHNPKFQKLEASWRGLVYLLEHEDSERKIKIRVLNASWPDLTRDIERAIEFDRSELFEKIYTEQFGTRGGEPFGMLIGDYNVRHRPGPNHPSDDLETLRGIAGVAAAAFAPFICAADSGILGLEHFGQLERPLNLTSTFDQLEYARWKSFRQMEDAKFIGLTLPRVLMRLPYGEDSTRIDHFRFHEDVAGPDQRKYLWGNAAFAFGGVVMRAFADFGWMADIRGFKRDDLSGGLVNDLPQCSFGMEQGEAGCRFSTEVVISDTMEKELEALGFIPLSQCQYTNESVFFSNNSVHKPKTYTDNLTTVNARISGMLQYVFCVSRFSHYLKIQASDRIGGYQDVQKVQDWLTNWLNEYTADVNNTNPAVLAKYPLREASVVVTEVPGKPGVFKCVIQLSPHYQMDSLSAGLKLTTEIAAPASPK